VIVHSGVHTMVAITLLSRAVIRATDHGLTVDAAKIKDMMDKALQAGELAVSRADGAFTIAAGQARWGNVVAHADGGDLTLNGVVDLSDLAMDARLILSAAGGGEGVGVGPPDVFIALKGPVATPNRTLDVSAFTGWLTLRAVERQSKQLESLQSERHEATVGTIQPPAGSPPPAASAPPMPAPPDGVVPPAPPRVAPRRALAPTSPDQLPPLPPPIEIRPAPEPRAVDPRPSRAPAPRSSEAPSASVVSKPRPNSQQRPAEDVPSAAGRSILDPLFGPQR